MLEMSIGFSSLRIFEIYLGRFELFSYFKSREYAILQDFNINPSQFIFRLKGMRYLF